MAHWNSLYAMSAPRALQTSGDLVLTTERLIMRLGRESDATSIITYFHDNHTHLAESMPALSNDFYTPEYWDRRLSLSWSEWQQDQSLRLFLFDRRTPDVVMGTVSLTQIVRGPLQACYLGYGIASRYEGKGMMTEALRAVIHHAFSSLDLHRIMANYRPSNLRSARLLERLGFVVEGLAKDYLIINGKWCDHVLTSLVRRT